MRTLMPAAVLLGSVLLLCAAPVAAAEWYIDATAGDTANNGLTPGTAKKYLGQVFASRNRPVSLLTAGDTVHIAAGTYADTIIIDTDAIWVIGADSATTILDYGDSSAGPRALGIHADTQAGLVIRDLRVTGCRYGIDWLNVSSSRLDRVTVTGNDWDGLYLEGCTNNDFSVHVFVNGGSGVYLQDADNNRFVNCTADSNGSAGIMLVECDSNTFAGNTLSRNVLTGFVDYGNSFGNLVSNSQIFLNGVSGIELYGGGSHRITGNAVVQNDIFGIAVYSDSVVVMGNLIRNNFGNGLLLSQGSNNLVVQNTFDSNSDYAVDIGLSVADTVVKNNFIPCPALPDSGVVNYDADTAYSCLRNYWSSTDSTAIAADIRGPGAGRLLWQPYRLGTVDTTVGADTIAPAAPLTVTATAYGGCTVTWSASASSEEIGGGAPGDLAGYRVYRATSSGTSYWAPVGATVAGVTAFCDTTITSGVYYRYRVTALDNHAPWPNESWYSDSIAMAVDTMGANAWYVNDTLTAGDSFCSAAGAPGNDGLSRATPKLSLAAVFPHLTAGDTLYLDAGWYPTLATLTCSGISNLWIIGADSRTVRVDAEAHWETGAVFRNLRNLYVANLEFTNCFWDGSAAAGVTFDSVAQARLEHDSFTNNDNGIRCLPGTDSLTVHGCAFSGNQMTSLEAYAAPRLAFTGNRVNGQAVILATGCDSAVLSGNGIASTVVDIDGLAAAVVSGNTLTSTDLQLGSNGYGCTGVTVAGNTLNNGKIIAGFTATGCTVSGNTVSSPGNQCFEVGGDSNTFSGNTASGTGGGLFDNGFRVESGAEGNVFTGNLAQGKSNCGFLVQGDANRFDSNVASGCATAGIRLTADAETNILRGNAAVGSAAGEGIVIEGDGNRLERNVARGNLTNGFNLYGQHNALIQNCADSNSGYGLAIHAHGAPNTYDRTDIVTAALRPDSGVNCDTTVGVDLRRTWWGTTDSAAIYARIRGSGRTAVQYAPWRLGFTDTGAGADTIAPAAPLSVTVTGTGVLACTVAWSASASSEDIGGGAPGDLAGYRVYRATSSGTTYWAPVGTTAAGDTDYVDTAVGYAAYYYRVTAFDNATPWPNESYYSDSLALADMTPPDTSGPNAWYIDCVNGDTANLGLTSSSPKRYLSNLLATRYRTVSWLTAGDTVYLAAGTYTETCAIDTDYIALIGADSLTTTIDYGDSSGLNPGPAGISADTRTGLLIRNLGVTNILRAISWRGVTNGRIENTWLRHCGRSGYGSGIDLGNCTAVVINNNHIYWCGNGMDLFLSTGLTVTNNLVDSNCIGGIFADMCPAATVTGNTVRNNWNNGIESIVDCDDWYIANNVATGNGASGFYSDLSDRGRYVNNLSSGNGIYGYELYLCHGVRFTGSRATDNPATYGQGYLLWRCDSTVVGGCDIDSNGAYAVYLDSGTADVVVKCNLAAGQLNSDSVVYAAAPDSPATLTRNWWGTTDSTVISRRVRGPGAAAAVWVPYRLGKVDTGAGADSVAPAPPVSLSIVTDTVNRSCTLSWSAAITNEEIGGGLTDLQGYRIYRDTSPTAYAWMLVGSTAGTTFSDSGLAAGDTFYYRVTAYDNHSPWENESWYSDSVVQIATAAKPGDFIQTGASSRVVDLADLAYLNVQVALYWGVAPADSRCDLNGDGILDFEDVAAFALWFGI